MFDAYGTLFDVHSAVARHATAVGERADEVSKLWRTKQLEYSWTRSLMGRHADFWVHTEAALDYAMATYGVTGDGLKRDLMAAYRTLQAYDEVPEMLRRLRAMGIHTSILSNGSPAMLEEAVRSAGLETLLDDLLSIEAVGIFKPDRKVYDYACSAIGFSAGAISFQSSNRWDVAGAANAGMSCVWINRGGLPDEYGFAAPRVVLSNLAALPDALV